MYSVNKCVLCKYKQRYFILSCSLSLSLSLAIAVPIRFYFVVNKRMSLNKTGYCTLFTRKINKISTVLIAMRYHSINDVPFCFWFFYQRAPFQWNFKPVFFNRISCKKKNSFLEDCNLCVRKQPREEERN